MQFEIIPAEQNKVLESAIEQFNFSYVKNVVETCEEKTTKLNNHHSNVLFMHHLLSSLREIVQEKNQASDINVELNKFATLQHVLSYYESLVRISTNYYISPEEVLERLESYAKLGILDRSVIFTVLVKEQIQELVVKTKREIKQVKELLLQLNYTATVELPESIVEPLKSLGLLT